MQQKCAKFRRKCNAFSWTTLVVRCFWRFPTNFSCKITIQPMRKKQRIRYVFDLNSSWIVRSAGKYVHARITVLFDRVILGNFACETFYWHYILFHPYKGIVSGTCPSNSNGKIYLRLTIRDDCHQFGGHQNWIICYSLEFLKVMYFLTTKVIQNKVWIGRFKPVHMKFVITLL